MKTTFGSAKLRGVSANVKSGQITLTLIIPLSDENFGRVGKLKPYLDAKVGRLLVEIEPEQPGLPMDAGKSAKDKSE